MPTAVQRETDAADPLTGPILGEMWDRIEAYYSAKLARHGAIPLGVDWSCTATQWLRFVQLLKVCSFDSPFSLIDLGCGYGALAAFLAETRPLASIDYLGIDLSPAMIKRARRRHRGKPATRFAVGGSCPREADYIVTSGTMNVKLGYPVGLWESFVRTILLDMRRMSKRGFAANFLMSPTPGAPPDQLYCCDPAAMARFCQETLDCSVEIVRDYGLREFTVLARCTPSARLGAEVAAADGR